MKLPKIYDKPITHFLSKLANPNFIVSKIKSKYEWRKENRSELLKSRLAIRFSALGLVLLMLAVFAFPTSSGAFSSTWQQTNWNGGVGSSTSSQYSSATDIDSTTSGNFFLQNYEKITNTTFDSNLNSWTTDNSEITPSVVETSIKAAASATSHSLAYNSTPTTGNILVATIGFNTNPGTVTVPSGWVNASESRINNSAILGRIAIYYKIVQDGDPTTFVVTNSVSAAVNFNIQEITGVDTTNPIDQTSTVNSGATSTTTSVIPATAPTTRASAIAIAGAVFVSASVFVSWSNGFNNVSAVNTYGYAGTKVLNSKQAVATTFTGVTARQNAGALVVFRGALASQQNSVVSSVIQSTSYTTELSPAMTLDTAPQVGNVMVAAVSYVAGTMVSRIPDGWVLDNSIVNAGYPRVDIFHKVVEAGEPPTFSVTSNTNIATFTLYELSGVDVDDLVDQVSSYSSGATQTNTAAIPATPTTTSSDAIAVAKIAMNSTSVFTSWSDGFTGSSTATAYGYSATKVLSSQQAVSTTFTGVTNRQNSGAIVVYKAAASQTPAEVQSKTQVYGVTTTLAASYVSPIQEGNTLFASFNSRLNTGTITPPAGWTQVAQSESASGRGTYLYSKVAGKNENQNQFFDAYYSLAGSVSIYEIRGLKTNDPIDKSTTFANVNANPLTFSIPTTSQDQAFILGGIGSSTTSGFPISWAANGFSTIPGSLTTEFQTGHKFQTSASAYSLSFTNASLRILQGYLVAYKSGGNYVDAVRNTTTKYSGAASAKISASPWAIARFTQSVNVGDTETYTISAKVYNGGDVVDDEVAQLFYSDDVIATNYSSLGGGWYKISADITGEIASRDIGVEVAKNNTIYVDDFQVNRFASTGTLTSNIFDTGRLSNWGNLNYVESGSGTVTVKARSSNSATMVGAPNFSTCAAIITASDISSGTNGCVTDAERYIQYQVILDRSSGQTPVFEDISIDYVGADQTPPDTNASNIAMFKSNGGDSVSLNGWTNGNAPYFTWDAGVDNAGGIGVAGYCVYVGTDNSADPVSTKGMLGTGDLDTRSSCPFATANNYLDLGAIGVLASAFTSSNAPYYINIKAIDGNDNIYAGSSDSFHFRFDNVAPSNPSYVNAPSNFISTKTATMTWPTSSGSAPADDDSGIAGLQYKIGSGGTWYGDNHTATEDFSDLLANDGEYTTQNVPDFAELIEGSNVIYFRTWDNAGNVSVGSVTTVLKINTAGAPSEPQNVTATPAINTQNSFAFSWIAPAIYVGNGNNLTYCYTINVTPTVNNCTYTNGGALSLAAGSFATQPGVNTIYVVAKDESGSINYASYGTAEFTANTAAPGIPLNPDIADTSVRSSSNWRLVVSWEPPTNVGAGVSSYQVHRSTDGINFSKIGSTGGSSYVDTGLSQVEYFYKIKACDSANNCGAFGSIVDQTPTGRYTTPAVITNAGGAPVISNIQTRSVDISWSTDRNSDSKVAFGIKAGVYGSTEAYKSLQTTDHKITLDNLSPGQTYFFVARWTDTDGNTGTTSELVFATLPPPTVQDVDAIGITLTGATIQYTTTGASKVKIYYGTTSGFGAVIDASVSTTKSTYLAQLNDLRDGTKYFYKVNTFDASGYEYDGTTIAFETPPAPKISNLRFQPVEGEKSSTQLITWDTNVPTTSELSYGVEGGETLTSLDTTLVTSHEVKIKDLIDDSSYRLIARSRDASSNLATSDPQTFRTALDTRPPKVSEVVVISSIRGTGADARGQIVVSWKTDEPATSQVTYGEGASGDLSNSSTQDGRLTLDHAVVISDLSTSKVYSVQAVSLDKGDNKATSDRQSAIIGRGTESALGIIFSVLQKIFGLGI